ncbi:uncharacterized protein LOC133901938 isoform X2 [Phragmites australis]|uniref:uncharacterized protein LOC133901938 isoform X2 n=1 Tax=Phragmites australis TaxID=29695 RepID=UPI002D786CB4|nr:uncharacterized protein LOC133901938 isoform X2 [Phragmites australis]
MAPKKTSRRRAKTEECIMNCLPRELIEQEANYIRPGLTCRPSPDINTCPPSRGNAHAETVGSRMNGMDAGLAGVFLTQGISTSNASISRQSMATTILKLKKEIFSLFAELRLLFISCQKTATSVAPSLID